MPYLALFLLIIASPAWAFRLVPMVMELEPKGKAASGTFTVDNNGKEKIAIQLEMKKRVINREGNETQPDTEDFVLFPEQMSLEPGEKRNIRITYVGSVDKTELPFRLIASQLPIDFAAQEKTWTGKASVKFLLEYVASVYVTPAGVSPKPVLKGYGIGPKKEMLLILANIGSAHFLLTGAEIKFLLNGKVWSPPNKVMEEIRSINLLPNSERITSVSVPEEFLSKDTKVEISFNK